MAAGGLKVSHDMERRVYGDKFCPIGERTTICRTAYTIVISWFCRQSLQKQRAKENPGPANVVCGDPRQICINTTHTGADQLTILI